MGYVCLKVGTIHRAAQYVGRFPEVSLKVVNFQTNAGAHLDPSLF
jgi:hypothetical protein